MVLTSTQAGEDVSVLIENLGIRTAMVHSGCTGDEQPA